MPSKSQAHHQFYSENIARVFEQAKAAHKAGRPNDAETGYREVLKQHPGDADVNYLLGALLLQEDRTEEALGALHRCLETRPDHGRALIALGGFHSKDGRLGEAIRFFKQATLTHPEDPKSWFNLGRAYTDNREFDLGADAYQKTMMLKPDHWEALNGLGVCFLEMGEIEGAIEAFKECVSKTPAAQKSHINLIRACIKGAHLEDAKAHCMAGLKSWPDGVRFHILLASIWRKLRDSKQAVTCLEAALEREPDNVTALNDMASCLYAQGLWKDAEVYARRSLNIKPASPSALSNLGRIRQMRGDLEGALTYYQSAIEINPDFADAYNNLGNVLSYMDRMPEAADAFDTATRLKPDSDGIRFNRAVARMTNGEISHNWRDYHLRFGKDEDGSVPRLWPWPEWQEESVQNKQVLLWTDQGIGDQVLFSRYAPHLLSEATHGVLECSPRLTALFERSFPTVHIRPQTDPPDPDVLDGPFDYHAAVMDMCCARFKTPRDVPTAAPLIADPTLAETLRQAYLERSGGKPLVGISWRSGGSHSAHFKSTRLEAWENILTYDKYAFVNLQYGNVGDEVCATEERLGITMITDQNIDPLGDLDPFAAQVAAVDLVITTSNTTAHLAGALGKTVWTFTPTGPGRLWYWFTEGSKTPWYASMTLLRHQYHEGWNGVLNEARTRLESFSTSTGGQIAT